MKKRSILAGILGLGLAGAFPLDNRTMGGNDPDVPHYLLESDMCARYAVLAAQDLSGTKYQRASAWDLAKENKLVANIYGNLEDLVNKGKLIPKSSIVTFYNSNSPFNEEGRLVTHATLYLGKNASDELVFAHQYHAIQTDETLNQLKEKGLVPREVIGPKD